MYKHETKTCPRCNKLFECRAGDINKCQCYALKLNDAERDYLWHSYHDCLCADCMLAERTACNQAQKELQLKQLFGSR